MQDEIPESMKNSDFFKILIEETQRLNTVVENYLQYARRQSSEKLDFEIKETIQNAVILLTRQFGKNGHKLKVTLPDRTFITRGDPNQLWQILINLLLNADQAMADEGEIQINLTVKIDQKLPNNEISEQITSEWYDISITDHGIGMTAEQTEKIFKPFFSSKSDGTGLGLAIVKRIVDENKWKTEIESKPGEGTTFHLIVPGVGVL
jgi:signal transduction histidine kinase